MRSVARTLRSLGSDLNGSRLSVACLVVTCLVVAGSSSGCVPKTRYDEALAGAAAAQAASGARIRDSDAEITRLKDRLKAAEAGVEDRDQKLSSFSTERHNVQAQLDEQVAINQQLRQELERLGKDVDQILREKGTLTKALGDAKARLDELRKAQAAAEARAQLFADLSRRFAHLVRGGQLTLGVRNNRFVMTVPADFLFEPNKTDVRVSGQGVLLEVAHVFKGTKRALQVGGHTDNVAPTKGSRFASNWELSAVRAVEVVRFMAAHDVPASSLYAAGFADVAPLGPNDTAQLRAKNRRVEIVLEPVADEIVPMPEPK